MSLVNERVKIKQQITCTLSILISTKENIYMYIKLLKIKKDCTLYIFCTGEEENPDFFSYLFSFRLGFC